jgi:hypothetical protein
VPGRRRELGVGHQATAQEARGASLPAGARPRPQRPGSTGGPSRMPDVTPREHGHGHAHGAARPQVRGPPTATQVCPTRRRQPRLPSRAAQRARLRTCGARRPCLAAGRARGRSAAATGRRPRAQRGPTSRPCLVRPAGRETAGAHARQTTARGAERDIIVSLRARSGAGHVSRTARAGGVPCRMKMVQSRAEQDRQKLVNLGLL